MPMFDLKCLSCGETITVIVTPSKPAPLYCQCGGYLTRLISAPSFHLKGGGWAKDLYSEGKK